jgi:dTMP kinase
MAKGVFIVLEGTDGSGKGTQFRLLVERLKKEGVKHATFDFPQYGKPSAYFVEQYLRGSYKGISAVGPKKGSLFYALDRFAASDELRDALAKGKVILSNRFTASNMGHQGAKMKKTKERVEFYTWLDELEFKILGIPRPTLNIILHVPAAVAQKLVDKKGAGERKYVGGAKRDIHEKNLSYLKKSEQTYVEMAQLFPKQFTLIECVEHGQLLSIERIQELIWKRVSSLVKRAK